MLDMNIGHRSFLYTLRAVKALSILLSILRENAVCVAFILHPRRPKGGLAF